MDGFLTPTKERDENTLILLKLNIIIEKLGELYQKFDVNVTNLKKLDKYKELEDITFSPETLSDNQSIRTLTPTTNETNN